MLDVFSLIFVVDTKIIFRNDFVAPLIGNQVQEEETMQLWFESDW